MFNERILKHFLSLCRLFTSSNQHAEQTDALCTKAYRINRSFENIRSQHPNIYYQSHIEFENLAKYIREPYYEKISVCKNLPNKRYNELEYEIYSRINFNQNWGVNIKNLDAHINEQLKNGIKNLLRYKAYKACKRYLPGFMYESNIKNVLLEIMSPEIPQLEPQITEIACKSTIAISQMCQYGEFVNCHSLKPALSIFAVELFITAIDAEGFDHLLGKWPFAMSNYYFDGGESSVQ